MSTESAGTPTKPRKQSEPEYEFKPELHELVELGGMYAKAIACTEAARVNVAPGPPRLLTIINQGGPRGLRSGAFTVQFNERRADVDGSGKVGGRDLLYWQNAFGSVSGNSNYNADVDLNGDGVVDGADLTLLAVWHGHIFF